MEDVPALPRHDLPALFRRLAARSAVLEPESYQHLLDELRDYRAMSHAELVADHERYLSRVTAPDALVYLRHVTDDPETSAALPVALRDLAQEIECLSLEAQRIMALSWSFVLHMKEKWDRTLVETGEDFVRLFTADPLDTRH